MASESITENVTLTTQERTWRIQIETQRGEDYLLEAFRETVRTIDGEAFGAPDKNAGVVRRALSKAALDTVTLDSGKTISVLELAEALVKHIETWRAEDLTPVEQGEE